MVNAKRREQRIQAEERNLSVHAQSLEIMIRRTKTLRMHIHELKFGIEQMRKAHLHLCKLEAQENRKQHGR